MNASLNKNDECAEEESYNDKEREFGYFLLHKLLGTRYTRHLTYPYDCRILPSVTVVRIRFRVNKSLVIFRKSSRNATYGLHCKYFITKYYAKYNLLGNGTWDLTRSPAHACRDYSEIA